MSGDIFQSLEFLLYMLYGDIFYLENRHLMKFKLQ